MHHLRMVSKMWSIEKNFPSVVNIWNKLKDACRIRRGSREWCLTLLKGLGKKGNQKSRNEKWNKALDGTDSKDKQHKSNFGMSGENGIIREFLWSQIQHKALKLSRGWELLSAGMLTDSAFCRPTSLFWSQLPLQLCFLDLHVCPSVCTGKLFTDFFYVISKIAQKATIWRSYCIYVLNLK